MSFRKSWTILVTAIQMSCFAPKLANNHYRSVDNISNSQTRFKPQGIKPKRN